MNNSDKMIDKSDFPALRKAGNELTFEMLHAIEYLALPGRGGKQLREIAHIVKVDERTLRRWRRDERFQAEVRRRSLQIIGESLPDVMSTIVERAVNDGSAKHAELLLKSLGMLQDVTHMQVSQVADTRSTQAIQEEIEEMKKMLSELDEEDDNNVIEAE